MKTTYKKLNLDNLSLFYREAGAPSKETILLLHGFPSSSYMFRDLIEGLSENYHVVAPDYPGFGLSSAPSPAEFEYTFDNVAILVEQFIEALKLPGFHLMVQDYGGPIGFRIASKRPEWIKSLIIQNANAYEEGLGELPKKIGAFLEQQDFEGYTNFKEYIFSLDGIKSNYLTGIKDSSKINPAAYLLDDYFMQRPGRKEIQHALFDNYGSNYSKYHEWQNYFKAHQPVALVVWGENDPFFSKTGAEAFSKDLAHIEYHFFDSGHFMLEEYAPEVAELIHSFIQKLQKNISLGSVATSV